jgi:hypothetical protein
VNAFANRWRTSFFYSFRQKCIDEKKGVGDENSSSFIDPFFALKINIYCFLLPLFSHFLGKIPHTWKKEEKSF